MAPLQRNWSASSWERIGSPDPGVGIVDTDRGVIYYVTIGRDTEGEPFIATLEIEPQPGVPVDSLMLRRVPVTTILDYALAYLHYRAELLAARGSGRKPAGNPLVFGMAAPGAIEIDDGMPTSEEIAEMMTRGMTRHDIAKRYGRKPSTVSDWIGKAYREVPELMPPKRAGRKPAKRDPQTPDAPASGQPNENGEQE